MNQNEVYVGARYVPVFADDPWSDDRTYEPLTVVLHEGSSYTSRQYVPEGISINNGLFWAKTGDYNAQVDLYRQEINELQSNVDNLQQNVTAFNDDLMLFKSMSVENIEDDYAFINIITLPKSIYNIKMDINNTTSEPANLAEYVLSKMPFIASNFTNGSSYIYNGAVYGNSDYAGSTHESFYSIDSENNTINIVNGDGVTTYNDLLNDYEFGAFSSQSVIINGVPQEIDMTVQSNYEANPRKLIAFDDNNWYIVSIIGRIETKIGYTLQQIQDFAIAKNWPNVCVLDGGGSVQTIFGNPFCRITPILDSDRKLRDAYYCIAFNEKE